MSTAEKVRAAASPQEALLAIAEALDLLVEHPPPAPAWGEWPSVNTDPALAASKRSPYVITETEDGEHVEVTFAPPTPDQAQQRRALAERLFAGGPPPWVGSDEGAREAYVEGGATWLYLADREFVMGLPEELRREMVEEVLAHSPHEAAEMGRDVLKDAGPAKMRIGEGADG